MGTIAPQITSLTIVYSTVYSDADQRKYQSSASLAFVRGIHRRPVNSPQRASNTENVSMSSWKDNISGQIMAWSVKQQAITLTNIDPDLCNHMVWIGNNEFMNTRRYQEFWFDNTRKCRKINIIEHWRLTSSIPCLTNKWLPGVLHRYQWFIKVIHYVRRYGFWHVPYFRHGVI